MALASSTTCHHPHFRLLLHGKDGSIPYLTPELTRLMFCPESECNDENESSSLPDDDDWKWRREHFILGVAAKDTCVTAMYRTVTPKKRKQDDRDGNGGDRRSAKRARKEQQPSDTTSTTTTSDQDQSGAPFKNDAVNTSDTPHTEENNGGTDKMKPSGYTFIKPSQSYHICTLIKSAHAADDRNIDSNDTSNYLHSYLRIPKYISTMIVPTFSLDYPNTPTSDGNSAESHNKGNKKHEPKKAPPPSNNHPKKQTQKQQQQQQQQNTDAIPNSTKDTMPINTPHGWQKIRPEQYWDAVTSLTQPVGSASSENGTQNKSTSSESVCEGAVGLFDHMGSIDRDQLNNLFAEYTANSSSDDGIDTVSMTQSPSLEITSPKNGKWDAIFQRVSQRTNDWSSRVLNYRANSQDQQVQPSVKFWTPVHLAASRLPHTALLACTGSIRTSQGNLEPNSVPSCANMAIVGWNAIRHSREFRRQALHNLLATMQSSPSPPQNYLVLSVNDLQSILDIAREGAVSIIGTDLVREWSHGGKALCLDMTFDGGVPVQTANKVIGGMMEMNDETYARDSLPILPGCKCLACRPRTTSAKIKSSCSDTEMMVPSFSRAYIHHLIKANEMLAETLLFVHNLHQMLLLFRQLSRAVALDAGYRRDGKGNEATNFEAICTRIEEQLKSSSV